MLENLHPKVREQLVELDKKRQRLLASSAPLSTLERIVREHYPDRINFEVGHAFLTVQTHRGLVRLLRDLSREGWRLASGVTEDLNKTGWNVYLRHRIRKNLTIGYTLYCTIPSKSDGPGCRRVQVGTETVEKPVYEIVCDEPEEVDA